MYNPRLLHMKKLHFVLTFVPFTEMKHQHDHDEDSAIGSSLFTDTISTTFFEVKCHLLSLLVHACSVVWLRPAFILLYFLSIRIS